MAEQDIQIARQAMSAVAVADATYDCGLYAHASAPPPEEAAAVPIVVADAGSDFANTSS